MDIQTAYELIQQVWEKNKSKFGEVVKELSKEENAEEIGKLLNYFVEYVSIKATPDENGVKEFKGNEDKIKKLIKEGQVIVIITKRNIIITGNTYPIKEKIKKAGFFYDPNSKDWDKSVIFRDKVKVSKIDLEELKTITPYIFIN